MKKFLLAAAAALCLLFGGCSLQPASEPLPAEALAQTLPDGLTDSELYLQALESGAAILYNREPITASETTKEAVASLEEDGSRFELQLDEETSVTLEKKECSAVTAADDGFDG